VKLLLFSLITIIFGYVVIFHSVLSSQVGGRLFLSYYLKQIDFSHILQMLPIITHELKTYSPNFYLFFIFSLIALSIKHMVQKKYHTQIGLLLFVFVALVFLLSINSQPLPHYIIQFYPFLFLLIGFNLQALELQKRMRTYVFYFLILFYLTGSYNPHLYQQAKTSYQEHKLMVQHLDEKYGADSYLASEPGSNFYWNSRAFWYFQNDKSYFYISDENSQIDIEPQGKIIYICEDLTADSAYCENFSSKKKLEKIDQIYIGQKFFFIYKSSGS